jgi:hypothetical protein
MTVWLNEAAEPEVAECFAGVTSKAMPDEWQAERQYGFQVRVAPTRQSKKPGGGGARAGQALLAPGYRSLASRLGEINHAFFLSACASSARQAPTKPQPGVR